MGMRQELLDTLAHWVEAQVCSYCPLVDTIPAKTDCPTGDCEPSETTCPADYEIGGFGCYHKKLWDDLVILVDQIEGRVAGL